MLIFVCLLMIIYLPSCGYVRGDITQLEQEQTIPEDPNILIIKNDKTPPTTPSNLSFKTWSNLKTESPIIYFNESLDFESGVDYHEVKIINASGDITPYTKINRGDKLTGLNLSQNITYRFVIRAVDRAGLKSQELQSDGWKIDPDIPTSSLATFNDGSSEWSQTKSPMLSWSGFVDNASGIKAYEIAIGSSPGETDILNWMDVGTGTNYQITDLNLTRGQAYYASLRAVDYADNYSTVINGDGWFVNGEFWMTNGVVNSVHIFENNIFIGGSFTEIQEWTGNGLFINLNSAQPFWHNPSSRLRFNGDVNQIISDGYGGYYVGGAFNAVGGIVRNNMAHILANGSLDVNWHPDFNNTVNSLHLKGSTLYVGGAFTSIDGITRNRLASFNTSTGYLTSWNPDSNGNVKTIHSTDSAIYVGGSFTTIGSISKSYLASFDLSNGTLNNWNPNPNNYVNTIASNGTALFIGGAFNTVTTGSLPRWGVANFSLNNGSLLNWIPNATGGDVNAIHIKGNTLYIGGAFTQISSVARNRMASYDISKGTLNLFNPNISNSVNTITTDNSTLYVAGNFTTVNGASNTPRNYLASYSLSNGTLNLFAPEFKSLIKTLEISSDGQKLFVGGSFNNFGAGINRNRLASFNLTTGTLNNWNPNLDANVKVITSVGSIANIIDSTLFVGGFFSQVGGSTPRSKFAAFNLTTGTLNNLNPLSISTGTVTSVNAIEVAGTNLYIGGNFSKVGSLTRNNLVGVNLANNNTLSMDLDINGPINALHAINNNLYLGGSFTQIAITTATTPRNRLASLALSDDSITTWNPDLNSIVNSITSSVQSNKLIVGGYFTTINNNTQTKNYLAFFNLNNGNEAGFDSTLNNGVTSLLVNDNTLYVGGSFSKRLEVYDLSDNSIRGVTSGTISGTINSMALSNSTLFIGGSFNKVDNSGASNFAPIDSTTGLWLPGN